MDIPRNLMVAAAFALAASAAHAQAPTETPLPATPAPALSPHVAAGTVIELAMVDPISSRTAKQGDKFALRLATPILAGDMVLVPAGVIGEGEVIDAGRGGFGGKPGKLVLAARFLTVDGQPMSIRGLKVGVGKDYYNEVLAVSMLPYVGLASLFMTGGNIDIPADTRAVAKIGADFAISSPLKRIETPMPAPTAVSSPTPTLAPAPSIAPETTREGNP